MGRDRPAPSGCEERPTAPTVGLVWSLRETMSTTNDSGQDSTEIKPRTRRALSECMSVLTPDFFPVVDSRRSIVSVTTGSGSTYTVDVREERCTCPDQKHRSPDGGCKHIRRARIALGRTPVPADVFGSVDIDDSFGANVDATANVATADGGIIDAGDEAEIIDESADEGRPEACECSALHDDATLPCWPCYRDGFETPAQL